MIQGKRLCYFYVDWRKGFDRLSQFHPLLDNVFFYKVDTIIKAPYTITLITFYLPSKYGTVQYVARQRKVEQLRI